MRLDKFLWCVRVHKTRPLAVTAIKAGHVMVNEKTGKPSLPVKVGDQLRIRKGEVEILLDIKGFPSQRVGAARVEEYVIDLTPKPTKAYHLAHQETAVPKAKVYKEKQHKLSRKEREEVRKRKGGIVDFI